MPTALTDDAATVLAAPVESSFAVQHFSDWSAPESLGPTVNSSAVDFGPEISRDGLSLYFASTRTGGFGATDLWVSQRPSKDAPWGAPVNLGTPMNSAGPDAAPHLSRDGHRLFFGSARAGGFGSLDNWVSWRTDTHDDFAWESPVNLGSQVNSSAFDAGSTVRNPELYFSSDRANPGGNLDIYRSLISRKRTYDPAALVVELSSSGNDLRPTLRFDALEIFLSSDRAGTLGSLGLDDIWVSTRRGKSEAWPTPINVGTPINTEFIEMMPALSGDGTTLYFASNRPGSIGVFDLWVARRTRGH